MMNAFVHTRLDAMIRSFVKDETASVTLEAVLVFPVLIWAYVGSFVFFDAFRAQNLNMKAAYTLADMVTRESAPLDDDYLDGLNLVYDFMVRAPFPTWIRVTSITWMEEDDEFRVNWSHGTKGQPGWTTESLKTREDEIPMLADGAYGIIVEASTTYQPGFNVGFTEKTFENFVVTSPRFVPRVCWETSCLDGL